METGFFTRRDFLRHLTLAGAAALLPLPAGPAAGAYVPIGKAGGFSAGTFRAATLPGNRPVYVRRLPGRSPRFLALSAVCTHKGCSVSWDAADHRFHCPCHRGLFDAQGRNVGGPPPRPLTALSTKIERGILFVKA